MNSSADLNPTQRGSSARTAAGLLPGILVVGLVIGSCGHDPPRIFESVHVTPNPAAPGSGQPNLMIGDDGRCYLSWIEPGPEGRHRLRFAVFEEGTWSDARTIAKETQPWFVNWADFPSLVAFEYGALAAHWLVKSGEGTYAYDVNIAWSFDGGTTWSAPVVPHRDGTQTEHGFVSMLPWPDGSLLALWLDGRNFAEPTNAHNDDVPSEARDEMTLRTGFVHRNGSLSGEAVLDGRACECCQTAAVRTPEGALMAYRDRSEQEVRDIAVVRLGKDGWSRPRIVHTDNWLMPGCPVNGPALASDGARVVLTWFTAANDEPKVKVAFSQDAGGTFESPVQVNVGEAIGRVDALLLSDGSALVSWMETSARGGEILVRRVHSDGGLGPIETLASTGAGRASGFPRMVRAGETVHFAWVETGNPPRLRTAAGVLPSQSQQ